jgi:hypothetical protein
MKTSLQKITMSCLIMISILTACKKDAANPGDPGTISGGKTPHVIMGTIYNANGQKFSTDNGHVVVHVWGPGEIGNGDVSYNISMDANGHYEMKVADGIYAFHAYAFMQLNGKQVCIDLQTLDGISPSIQQASAPGIVKDFALKLSGLVPDGDPSDANSYNGGHVWVGDGSAFFTSTGYWDNLAVHFPGATVTFTLTPEGNCLDGSPAPLKQITCSVEDLEQGKYLVNFPYALYKLNAALTTTNGEQKSLNLSPIPGIENTYDYLELSFPPDPGDPDGHPLNPQVAVWEH